MYLKILNKIWTIYISYLSIVCIEQINRLRQKWSLFIFDSYFCGVDLVEFFKTYADRAEQQPDDAVQHLQGITCSCRVSPYVAAEIIIIVII